MTANKAAASHQNSAPRPLAVLRPVRGAGISILDYPNTQLTSASGALRSRGRPRANATGDPIPVALANEAEVVVDLQPEPGFRRNTEVCSQPQCRIGGIER